MYPLCKGSYNKTKIGDADLMNIKKKFLALSLITALFAPLAHAAIPSSWHENKIFILPEEGRTPWLEAINHAERMIEMAAYKISDPEVLRALRNAAQRGVAIHIVVEPETYQHGGSSNAASPIAALTQIATVHTLSKRFSQSHHKMIVIDEEWGLISTGNIDQESFDGLPKKQIAAARDIAIPILDRDIIEEMLQVFRSDVKDVRISPHATPLVWGPDHQRSTFLKLFNQAKKTIDIYQQSVQDEGLVQAIAGAARTGVQVRVLMMPFPFGMKNDPNIPNQNLMISAGANVGLTNRYYMHAKVVIVDGKKMYVGSGNFYTPTLDQARELGIITENPDHIKRVQAVFESDWKSATINLRRTS